MSSPARGRHLLLRLASLAALAAAVFCPTASASELIDRNASNLELQVGRNGKALLSYNARGKRWNVLAWGAQNAIAPTTARTQLSFRLDYSGGYGTHKRDVWKTFRNVCRPYAGPELHWLVAACTAPDGSHWAVQSWQLMLPNYGLSASPKQTAWELRLSHWAGELPQLTVKLNWAYRTYEHLFGSFTYEGVPVHGFRTTSTGQPLDTFGRNLYVDTYDSAYGKGWRRENSFLMHRRTGTFCYGFYSHGARPVGSGTRYRATIIGPGVTPDIFWESDSLGSYDRDFDLQMHEEQKSFYAGDGLCKAV
ncbi:MAG: hypothetical protein H0W14_06345 [Actinobacteria bacterium]|nr:hypothetical protein [Actinomycetota bacterium]